MKKVFVVGGDSLIERMFDQEGWGVVDTPEESDLIQFTGGEDVDPALYGDDVHKTTYYNSRRDVKEAQIFNEYIDKYKAGICRGGQFLNVMSGGMMWQDVDGHLGGHIATDLVNNLDMVVTSTHHQMMLPRGNFQLFMVAEKSKRKATGKEEIYAPFVSRDVESVYYPETKSLCFQPHPEYVRKGTLFRDTYFNYLSKVMR